MQEIMHKSSDCDATTAQRALRLYQKLLLDGRKHFQSDLAEYLSCSPQTVMRLVAEIEGLIGPSLVTGLERHRRWYQIRSISRNRLGLDFEELRYLAICRDLASPYLPEKVKVRVDNSIFNFSMLMADQEYAERGKVQKQQFGNCCKGWINYTPYANFLEKIVLAIDEKRICLVTYKSPLNKKSKIHRFIPSRLVSMNGALYVLGGNLTEDFKKMRFLTNLAVHRIKDVTITDKIWKTEIPDADVGMFGLPWHEPKTFRIRFNAGPAVQYVKERIWSKKQKMKKQPDGSLVLELESRSEPEVISWVRSFGDDAQLLTEASL